MPPLPQHDAQPPGARANGPVQGYSPAESPAGQDLSGSSPSPFFAVRRVDLDRRVRQVDTSNNEQGAELRAVKHRRPASSSPCRPATEAEMEQLLAALHD